MKTKTEKPKRSLFRKIVNAFIGIFVFLIAIIILFIGFSQTSTFRNLLKDEIISLVETETNGKISIGAIDGTILTSVYLRDLALWVDKDTIATAKRIELKVSPLQLFIGKLFVRKIELSDIFVSLVEDANGKWNLDKFIKPTPETEETEFSLPFAVQVNQLLLTNINFRKQTFTNRNSLTNYPTINMDDFRVSDINLSSKFFLDTDNDELTLLIDNLSGNPNFKSFDLKNFSGWFEIRKDYAEVRDLRIKTLKSELKLTARLDSLNLFGGVELEDFKNYPMKFDLDVPSFNFDDLSSFLEATYFLKGTPDLKLNAEGKFGNIKINSLVINYLDTRIDVSGRVKNLHIPDKLYIDATMSNSKADYENVTELLPFLQLPEFDNLVFTNFDAEFIGEPTNFTSKIVAETEEGYINLDAELNLNANPIEYNIDLITEDINLSPILNVNTRLTTSCRIKGKGTSPENLNTIVEFDCEDSKINNISINSFQLDATARAKQIHFNIATASNNATADFSGNLDFTVDPVAGYAFSGKIKNLDLQELLNNPSHESNINVSFLAHGTNLDLNETNGKIIIGFDSTRYNQYSFEKMNFAITLSKEKEHRSIILNSPLADITLDGEFLLSDALELIAYESTTIADIVITKVGEFNVLDTEIGLITEIKTKRPVPEILDKNIEIEFACKLKDMEPLSKIMKDKKIDAVGAITGNFKNNSTNFSISAEMTLDYLLYSAENSLIYLSDFITDVNFSRDNRSDSFDKLFGAVSITGKRMDAGTRLDNVFADLTFNQSKAFFNMAASVDTVAKAAMEGILSINPPNQILDISDISLTYQNVEWKNKDSIKIEFAPGSINVKNFDMTTEGAELIVSGSVEKNGNQKLDIEIKNLSSKTIAKYFMAPGSAFFDGNLNLSSEITGTLKAPLIKMDLDIEDIGYQKSKLGSLFLNLDYKDEVLRSDLKLVDTTKNMTVPLLMVTGILPINLSFQGVEKRIPVDKNISFQVKTENFNINSFGNLVPYVSKQNGILIADISVSGILNDLKYNGVLKLDDGSFHFNPTNLDYNFGFNLDFINERIDISHFVLENSSDAKYRGTLTSSGVIGLKGFNIENIEISTTGDLAVMNQKTKTSIPYFYGDLFLGTGGSWNYTFENGKSFFKGDIILKYTNVTYALQQDASISKNDFIYNIIADTSRIDSEEKKFMQLTAPFFRLSSNSKSRSEVNVSFDYDINIKMERDAIMTFILSPAWNQKLYIEAFGELHYESYNGFINTQGAFQIREDSRLEFLKTFAADGLIRFESDITNPYLDIVATYINEWDDPNGIKQDVAVKIKFSGTVKELSTNLINDPQNISVYVGRRNIDNNMYDPRYTESNAFAFILIGELDLTNLTSSQRSQIAGETASFGTSTAASIMGPMLSGFLNSYVGDFVRSIQITQTGVSLSGRWKNFRYTVGYEFGGTSQQQQNVNQTNFKLEYLWTKNLALRIQRRSSVVETFGMNELINEFGLKYKFEF
ncbi:MAG: AsmA family protein [bacterium]